MAEVKRKPDPNALQLVAATDDDMAALLASTYLLPTAQVALTVQAYSIAPHDAAATLPALMDELSKNVAMRARAICNAKKRYWLPRRTSW